MEKIILKTENLTRHFGGLAALTGVTLEFRDQEILGIIGPNGAGKTTLINMITGIYLPTGGKIEFDGQDISELPAHRRCRLGLGRTFQLVRPLPGLSLMENIMVGALFGQGLGKRKARQKAEEWSDFLGLSGTGRDISRMTVLEIKKMEIARALAAQPRLLLLDEVMAGLNGQETMEMIDLVRKIHGLGITIGIVEHVMMVIRELTDRVIVLEWGEVIAEGPYGQVSCDPKVVTAYLGEEDRC
jgi:branched-chain amino acid transport system ATP-binding protein